MSGRISRIARRLMPVTLLCSGRKPRILPMSKEDERIQAELHRRADARRRQRENLR